MTLNKQIRDFNELGLYLNRQTLYCFFHMQYDFSDIKFSFLCMLADYWGKDVGEFISADYSILDRPKEEIKPIIDPELNEFL